MLDSLFKNKYFSFVYTLFLFLGACAVAVCNWEVNGAILFAYIASAALILSSRLTDAMLPAMLLAVFVTRCYDSADVFLAKLPLMLPVVAAMALHFLIYRKQYRENLRVGRSFIGLCAVTVAVTLGGLGFISSADYLSGSSLFYVVGLGMGMMLFYIIVKSNFTEDSPREVARIMYVTGLLACFCVLRFYVADWELFTATWHSVKFQSENNLSTFLMLAMPFPLYYASKRYVDVFSVILMYACILLTGSRGGQLMGTVEFFVILTVFACQRKQAKGFRILCGSTAMLCMSLLLLFLPRLASFFNIIPDITETPTVQAFFTTLKDYFLDKDDARYKLILRMRDDFASNPLFGVGIGYTGNTDLYSPAKGAMNWYHVWFAQVVGSMGILGILAYGYQLLERVVIFFKNRSLLNLTFFLAYIGLFLMSQVNPGEFCPIPYAALAVTFFAMMEERPKKAEPQPERSFLSIRTFL